jgi:hypothetical protein
MGSGAAWNGPAGVGEVAVPMHREPPAAREGWSAPYRTLIPAIC